MANWILSPLVCGLVLLAAAARADYAEGLAAYKLGDYAGALREWRPLAEDGNASAQFNLGLIYRNGRGVQQDYVEAVKWYRHAAGQGHGRAQTNLCVLYGKGEGIPQDYVEAVKWCGPAAEQGDPLAMFFLGIFYGLGQGVPQDYVQAYLWFNLAAAKLSPGEEREQSATFRQMTLEKMTPDQVAEAQKLAREWKPKSWDELKATTKAFRI